MQEVNSILKTKASIKPNEHIILSIVSALSESTSTPVTESPRTELDSHANMAVVGRHCFVFEKTGRQCDVSAFSPNIATTSLPIVDAVIVYDCPYTLQSYLLMVRNALYVEEMEHNLLPPFLLREAQVQVNDCAKVHTVNPSEEDHSIFFKDEELRIPLQLHGTFSYFNHRPPDVQEIDHLKVLFITPDSSSWNPHSVHFATDEAAFLDDAGHIIEHPSKRTRFLIEDEDAVDNTSIYSTFAQENALPTLEQLDTAIDATISTCAGFESTYIDPTSSEAQNDCKGFADALDATIGSMLGSTLNNDHDDLFCNEPILTSLDELEAKFSANVGSTTAKQPSKLSPAFLSKIWSINEDLAEGALNSNTHLQRQSGDSSLSRQFSTNDRMLRYKRINSLFYTDTFFATKSARSRPRGNNCMQIFVSDKGFVAVYPMKSKSDFKDCLHMFCKEIGVPNTLVMDKAGEQTSNAVKHFSQQVGLSLRVLEEHTQWANRAELYIGLWKESIRKDLRTSNCPLVLWDYCAERRALIHNLTPRDLFQTSGMTPVEATFGTQGDISNLCIFGWYEWCYYREEGKHMFPYQKTLLGKVLGPSKNEGNEMANNILTHNGQVVPRRTIRRLTKAEMIDLVEIKKRNDFDARITSTLGDAMSAPPESSVPLYHELHDFSDLDIDDEVSSPHLWPDGDPIENDGTATFEVPITDALINAEVLLPLNNEMQMATVKRRSTDEHGKDMGIFDPNPFLNTLTYDVEFIDSTVKNFGANVIAQNLYSQVDEHGHSQRILTSFLDSRKDMTAVTQSDMYITTKSGQQRMRKSTVGWQLLAQWKDGTQEWLPLRLLKEHYPVEVAEFATATSIDREPAFAFWVKHVLKKRNKIISAVKARVTRVTHKYGIEVPTSVARAQAIDAKNNNTLWMDSLTTEMNTIRVAFEFYSRGKSAPDDYTRSSGHIIWDVKMDFTRKARWVKNGHLTSDPTTSTFAGVVSRESIRILLTYAALNQLDVWAADIKSAYLQAPTSEKHYIVCGPEFGPDKEGCIAVITRALYGGKSAGSDYWKHMRACMTLLGFTSCRGDPDVWRRPATKSDGSTYYTYVCLYVDDCLVIDEFPESIIRKEIGKFWTMKESSIGPPKIYLGNKVTKVTLENDVSCWSFSSSQYTQASVANVEKYLKERNQYLPKNATAPFRGDYRPEIDVSPELNANDAAYYQSLIGILRWIVELGRVDLTVEVSEMASMMAMPREGHLDQLFHIFAHLKSRHNAEMVFDPTDPDIDESLFPDQDWTSTVYDDAHDEIAPDAPPPRGLGFKIKSFVDADHAGNQVTRRSRTGFIVFLNSAPIYWLSKRQTGIETSSFGSEFMAMKHCCEYLRGLRFKLRSMGIPVDFPCYIYGDNKSVLVNGSQPFSVLKKKSNSIAYHFVREGSAADEWRLTYVNTDDNCADMLSKSLPGGRKRRRFTGMILHHVYDYD